MIHHFDTELDDLKQQLLAMGSHAESAVQQAVQALVQRDPELARRVKENDTTLDTFEIRIDELAVHLLAKAPLATDLRLITVAMKVSQNLERVGDEASKIAKRARDLSQEPPLKQAGDIPRLSELAIELLKASLDAFVNHDPATARALIPRDKDIDALNKEIHRELARQMVERPDTITRCLNLMVVAKSLERIADHGKNIAEEVVYLFEAEDIRHAGRGRVITDEPAGGEA
jgi:phosphate transport system protein